MKNRSTIFTTILLACFALSQVARATPPPKPEDRGNGNSAAENVQALNLGTTGSNNTAHGWFSLFSNTTGSSNTADGFQALYSNTDGGDNTAYGFQALHSNTGSLSSHAGSFNTGIGYQALYSNSGASFRTASFNTAVGYQALYSNPSAFESTAIGYQALFNDIGGGDNTAIGHRALYNNTTGLFNTAVGGDSLSSNTEGVLDTAIGIGAGGNVTTASNVICIGAFVAGADVDNSCYIGNIWNQPGGLQAVYVNSDGKLGFQASSRRFKNETKPMEQASEVIYGLKPVSFRYKAEIEPTRPRGFGLIAEDVEQVSPDLVSRGRDGKVNSVRYDAVNAMLLNEFLKEHKKVEAQQSKIARQQATIGELESTVAQQQKAMEALATQLKEHAAQIQKVTAQIEINKSAPRTVFNNR
jgi:trimeric autotransporter adhesin